MATPEQPAYRKAVFEARAHAREGAVAWARERRKRFSIWAGFGLSFVLLGGVTGGYMALDRVSAGAAGRSVAIPLAGPSADRTPERAPARRGAVRLALAEMTGLQIALPPLGPPLGPPLAPPLAVPEAPAAGFETQRLLLGGVLAQLSDTVRNPPRNPPTTSWRRSRWATTSRS